MDLTNFWQRVDEKRKQGYTDTDILNGLSKNSPEFASKIEKSRQRYSVDKIQNDRDLVNFMSQGYSGKMPTVASVPVKTEQPEKPKVTIDRSSGILGSIAGGATDFLGGIAQGAKKGVASSMLGMASLPQQAGRALAEKITGQKSPEQFKTVREIADKTGMLERKGTAEAIGFGAEQLGEFIVPSGAISKFGKGRGLLARMATEAATFGGITAVQTGEVGEEAKTSALIGAAIPAVGTGLKVAKKLIRPAKDINGVVGEILQGSADDIVKGKKAFSKLDVSGVKNYNQLAQKADERIGMLAGSLDDLLSKKPNPIPLNNLQTSVKVGGKTVAHNYVDDALNQLDELYKKTNDPVMVEKVAQIRNKAQTQGLNLNNLNDLAKAYGEEFGNKAFSKRTGEALTSVNAQSFENTRKGVKEVARKLYGGKEFEAIDREMTNLIRVRKLSEDVAKKANELKQKVEPRGIGAATGRKIFNTIDTLTGGSISGFIRAAGIPRGAGYKTMNAIDLELKLNKNLKLLKSLEKSLEQKNVISQRIFGGTNKLLTESEKKALRKMPMGMSVKDIIKDPEMKKKVAEVFKHNLKMQVERTSPEAGAIVSKLDFAKANSIQEMMTIVKKALPTNLRNNPAISSAIKNWGGSAEQVKNVLPIKSFKQGVVPKTATGNIKPVSKPSLIQEAKKLFHHTDVKIGNVLKAGKPSVKNYFGEGIYATNTKGGYPGKFIKEFQTPEGLKTLDLTKKGADDKFLNEVSKITKTPLEKTGMGVYEDLRLMASKSSDDIIRKAVDKITKGYEVIKSPLGYEGQFETVIRKSILPIKKVSKPLVKPSLIQKAKKYKTAEEFVKAQGTPVYKNVEKFDDVFGKNEDLYYHGSPNKNITNLESGFGEGAGGLGDGVGVSLTNTPYNARFWAEYAGAKDGAVYVTKISPDVKFKVFKNKDAQELFFDKFDDFETGIKELKKQGYGGIKVERLPEVGENVAEKMKYSPSEYIDTLIFDPKKVKIIAKDIGKGVEKVTPKIEVNKKSILDIMYKNSKGQNIKDRTFDEIAVNKFIKNLENQNYAEAKNQLNNISQLKTKSQLTDIWKEANRVLNQK